MRDGACISGQLDVASCVEMWVKNDVKREEKSEEVEGSGGKMDRQVGR